MAFTGCADGYSRDPIIVNRFGYHVNRVLDVRKRLGQCFITFISLVGLAYERQMAENDTGDHDVSHFYKGDWSGFNVHVLTVKQVF